MDSELREYQSKISRYSDDQLEEILVTLNKDKFPEKYNMVLSTLKQRQSFESVKADVADAVNMSKTEVNNTLQDEAPSQSTTIQDTPIQNDSLLMQRQVSPLPETSSEEAETRLFTSPIKLKDHVAPVSRDHENIREMEDQPSTSPLTSISDIVNTPFGSSLPSKQKTSSQEDAHDSNQTKKQPPTPIVTKTSLMGMMPSVLIMVCVIYIQLTSLFPALPGKQFIFSISQKVFSLASPLSPLAKTEP